MISIALKLLIAHAIFDFVLQPTAMAMGKNRHHTIHGSTEEQKMFPHWPYWLTSHALVHGGAVWFVTGSMTLGVVETGLHWIIDFVKCEERIGTHTDQFLHLATKAVYLFFI